MSEARKTLRPFGWGGGVTEEVVEAGHGVGRGLGLFGAEGTGGWEETGVHGTTIVQQVAYGYL